MSDEIKFTLHNPLTEEEWDMITDVDFDHTSEITFHTKHGKEVVFVKRKTGKWIGYNIEKDGWKRTDGSPVFMSCSECNGLVFNNGSSHWNFCPNCGSYNGGEE